METLKPLVPADADNATWREFAKLAPRDASARAEFSRNFARHTLGYNDARIDEALARK